MNEIDYIIIGLFLIIFSRPISFVVVTIWSKINLTPLKRIEKWLNEN